jgi:hypothetical protein
MNSEERRLLSEFLDQLVQVKGVPKDPDAADLIAQAATRQPDAVYLLVQKALLQEQALNSAKAQIANLRSQLEQAKTALPGPRSGSFLGGGDPWAAPARPAPAAAAAPWNAAPQAGGGSSPWGGFLGTAAATAAGIAGGAFLFQGIENLLGHHGSGQGLFDTADASPEQVENVTINEYYDTDDNEPGLGLQESDFDDLDDGFDAYDDDDDSLSA